MSSLGEILSLFLGTSKQTCGSVSARISPHSVQIAGRMGDTSGLSTLVSRGLGPSSIGVSGTMILIVLCLFLDHLDFLLRGPMFIIDVGVSALVMAEIVFGEKESILSLIDLIPVCSALRIPSRPRIWVSTWFAVEVVTSIILFKISLLLTMTLGETGWGVGESLNMPLVR